MFFFCFFWDCYGFKSHISAIFTSALFLKLAVTKWSWTVPTEGRGSGGVEDGEDEGAVNPKEGVVVSVCVCANE